MSLNPPFRADHVGSFLRPKYLIDAREQKARGEITAAQLRAVEDKAIAEVVKMQQDVGLQSITDGEFRRTFFHIDFLEQLGGVRGRGAGQPDHQEARRQRRPVAAGAEASRARCVT